MDVVDFLGLGSVPATWWRTLLRLAHFGGLALGLGGMMFVDLAVQRSRRTGMSAEALETIGWMSHAVAAGLALLWLSGIGFLAFYRVFEPEKLANPKIWAKMTIVAALTANGVFVHRAVLPFLRARIGRPLFEGVGRRVRAGLAACAAVSAVSWTVPVLLGAAPQLNFTTPYLAILAAWAASVAVAFAAIALVLVGAAPAGTAAVAAVDDLLPAAAPTAEAPERGA